MTIFHQDMIETQDLTIDISEDNDLTNALDLRGKSLVGIIMPSALTSTAVTFKFSDDNSTFTDVYDSNGNQLSVTVAASRYIALDKEDFLSARYLKILTGSAEAADRTITAVMRAV